MPNRPINQRLRDKIVAHLKAGPAESAAIAEAIGEIKQSVMSCLCAMAREEIVDVHAPGGKSYTPRVYSLARQATTPTKAATRTVIGKDRYMGEAWPHEVARPGSAAHLQCPSRRGNVLVYHTGKTVPVL
jgi:hypothetical protein